MQMMRQRGFLDDIGLLCDSKVHTSVTNVICPSFVTSASVVRRDIYIRQKIAVYNEERGLLWYRYIC